MNIFGRLIGSKKNEERMQDILRYTKENNQYLRNMELQRLKMFWTSKIEAPIPDDEVLHAMLVAIRGA